MDLHHSLLIKQKVIKIINIYLNIKVFCKLLFIIENLSSFLKFIILSNLISFLFISFIFENSTTSELDKIKTSFTLKSFKSSNLIIFSSLS